MRGIPARASRTTILMMLAMGHRSRLEECCKFYVEFLVFKVAMDMGFIDSGSA
jgi:hypothetical protein